MAGSTFGTLFKITTWGESHGAGVGVVVDGCPAGLSLCEDDIQKFLNRRKLLMYCAFADSKLLSCLADGCIVLDNVSCTFNNPFFHVFLQWKSPL